MPSSYSTARRGEAVKSVQSPKMFNTAACRPSEPRLLIVWSAGRPRETKANPTQGQLLSAAKSREGPAEKSSVYPVGDEAWEPQEANCCWQTPEDTT